MQPILCITAFVEFDEFSELIDKGEKAILISVTQSRNQQKKQKQIIILSTILILYFQTKGKFIMLKVLKELSGKSSFRPVSDEVQKRRFRSKSQSTMVSI